MLSETIDFKKLTFFILGLVEGDVLNFMSFLEPIKNPCAINHEFLLLNYFYGLNNVCTKASIIYSLANKNILPTKFSRFAAFDLWVTLPV